MFITNGADIHHRYPVLHEKAVRQELMSNLQVQWHFTGLAVLAMRCKYTLLVAAMKRRFTPIQMTAVQAQLFRNRQQQEKGTMDRFFQELQKLYNLAYGGSSDQQSRTLLANRFVDLA